ncbi:MAG: hypothetical protein NTU44_16005 [Bacteroidetes bacterium]|nr:hypothetical protein [Bacteroidota bacterium]
MKILITLTLTTLLFVDQVTILSGQTCPNISGQITYLNNAATPLYDVQVQLRTTTGEVLQTTTTDYLGRYSFCQTTEGTYQLKVSSTRPVGGINSTDALIALWAFMGLGPLTGLTWRAADVNLSNYLNTTDALLILQRYAGAISTFPAGNWVFETGNVTLTGDISVLLNLKGTCYGDLDGTFVPAGCTPLPSQAIAGPDQTVIGTTTNLAGNTPLNGTGTWTIVSGMGGTILQINDPTSSFTGTSGTSYILTWSVSTTCATSVDTVEITLTNPPMGSSCPGIPSFSYGGQSYNTVLIGTQCWMKENLNIGTMINGSSNQTNNPLIEKYCYDNNPARCNVYGGLYQWNEMMQYSTTAGTQGICPNGWHIPIDEEWQNLVDYLGSELAGGKMKEIGTIHWFHQNTGATNISGFTALGSGHRDESGNFNNLNGAAPFWSSSEFSSNSAIDLNLVYSSAQILETVQPKIYGFSVRCIKN